MRSLLYIFCGLFCCCFMLLPYSNCDAGVTGPPIPVPQVAVPQVAVPQVAVPQVQTAVPQYMTLRKQRVVYDQQVVEEDVTVRQQRLQITPRVEEYEVQVQVPTIQQVAVTPQIQTYVQTQAVCTASYGMMYGTQSTFADACYRQQGTMVTANCCQELTPLQVAVLNAQRNLRLMEADSSTTAGQIRRAKRALARLIKKHKDAI